MEKKEFLDPKMEIIKLEESNERIFTLSIDSSEAIEKDDGGYLD